MPLAIAAQHQLQRYGREAGLGTQLLAFQLPIFRLGSALLLVNYWRRPRRSILE